MNNPHLPQVGKDIKEYFKESGYSRTPSDYAERWFMDNYDLTQSENIKFKVKHFEKVEEIAGYVMDWDRHKAHPYDCGCAGCGGVG